MSREDVEVVRAALGRIRPEIGRGDWAEFVACLSADVEFEVDPFFPQARVSRGRHEVRRWLEDFSDQFERLTWALEDVRDVGGSAVLVCFRLEGVGKGSGAPFEVRPGWVYTVQDGEVVRMRAYLDRHEAFKAVGPEA